MKIQNNKNLVIAVLAIAMLVMATTHAALADTPKASVKPLSTSKFTSFSWNDCSGAVRTMWFQPQLSTPPVTQMTVAWSWPSFEKAGFFCNTANFGQVSHTLTDVTQNWTTDDQVYTTNQNTNGVTFTLVSGGNTKTVNYNDSVKATDWACYGLNPPFCTDTRQFTTAAWNAT